MGVKQFFSVGPRHSCCVLHGGTSFICAHAYTVHWCGRQTSIRQSARSASCGLCTSTRNFLSVWFPPTSAGLISDVELILEDTQTARNDAVDGVGHRPTGARKHAMNRCARAILVANRNVSELNALADTGAKMATREREKSVTSTDKDPPCHRRGPRVSYLNMETATDARTREREGE